MAVSEYAKKKQAWRPVLRLDAALARQADFGALQLLLDLRGLNLVDVRRGARLVILQRVLPLRDRLADFSFADVNIAQVIVDRPLARHVLQGAAPQLLRFP